MYDGRERKRCVSGFQDGEGELQMMMLLGGEVLTEAVVSISDECVGGEDTRCEEGELVRGKEMVGMCRLLLSRRSMWCCSEEYDERSHAQDDLLIAPPPRSLTIAGTSTDIARNHESFSIIAIEYMRK